MNFIRIDHTFVNLSKVEDICLIERDDGEIDVVVTYRSGREITIHVGVENDNVITTDDAMDALADAIQNTIQDCVDADCENIEDYIEE